MLNGQNLNVVYVDEASFIDVNRRLTDITCRNCGHHNHLWTKDYKQLQNKCSWFTRNKTMVISCACKKWAPIDNLEYLEWELKRRKQ